MNRSDTPAAPTTKAKTAAITPFQRRFGAVGQALSESIPGFSLDVVGVVASFLVCGSANPGAQANLLLQFGGVTAGEHSHFRSGGCVAIACHPFDSTLWVANFESISIFSDEGVYVRQFDITGHCYGLAFSETAAYLSLWDQHRIAVCDLDGKALCTFAPRGLLSSASAPAGIAYDKIEETLYVADRSAHAVVVLNDRKVVRKIGDKLLKSEHIEYARGVCLSETEVFVSDMLRHRILVFDRSGQYLRSFGKLGSEPGQFNRPRNMCLDKNGSLLVTILTPNGVFITQINSMENGWPYDVCVARDGRIFVADAETRVVQVFAFEA